MDTKQKIEELSMHDPIVHKAMQHYHHAGDYEKCLEVMVIALSEKADTLQKECARLHMNAPVVTRLDGKGIDKAALDAMLGK